MLAGFAGQQLQQQVCCCFLGGRQQTRTSSLVANIREISIICFFIGCLQVFGDSEEINGYKGLQIDIWLAVNSYHCWCVGVSSDAYL